MRFLAIIFHTRHGMMTAMQWILNKSALGSQQKNTPEIPDLEPNPEFETLLFDELLNVAKRHPYIKLEDYDMDVVRQHIIRPIATYMGRVMKRTTVQAGDKRQGPPAHQPPLIVSGHPGIGKTTLLMMMDQALTQLTLSASFSCRALLTGSAVAGYYGDVKGTIDVTPLHLQETQTAVLSILDWRNIQRHWTYDSERTYRETPEARADFLNAFRGKVVFVDDAEKEGHVFFVSQLAQHGILVVISSNLDYKALHIDDIAPMTVYLSGKDHRVGDITEVCLPAGENALFDAMRTSPSILTYKYEKFKIFQRGTTRVAYAQWADLKDQPLLKDSFAEYFRKHTVQGMLLDAFPFFSEMLDENINPGTLGHLYRFVHLIDAVHDLKLPFMLRMTQAQALSPDYNAAELEQMLCDYDEKLMGYAGAAAWIEISRCLSRLRSRQSLNTAFFPAFMQGN